MAERKFIDWSLADWSKTDPELAVQFGVTRQNVQFARGRHSSKKSPAGWGGKRNGSKPRRVDWSRADFSKPVSVLARKFGVSERMVRKARSQSLTR